MTTPTSPRSTDKAGFSGAGPIGIRQSAAAILTGGTLAALAAFFVQKQGLALGLFLGSLLSLVQFHSLDVLSGKILKAGNHGRKIFWFWTVIRWALAALVCWGLVLISPSCLLGALAGYMWALAVLGWKSWRNAASPVR